MNTLKNKVVFEGVGIHSGQDVTMTVKPSAHNGITFILNNQSIKVNTSSIGANHTRSTTLTNGHAIIQTPEHFLAACYALQLTNIDVILTNSELPILDGSAIIFLNKLNHELSSIPNQSMSKLIIKDDIHFKHNDSDYFGFPSDSFIVETYLSYPNDWLKSMSIKYEHNLSNFFNDIAPARTFGFKHEIETLKKHGLAKGGSLDNALIVSEDGFLNDPRFNDEIIRHKVLDFIGDMAISGKRLIGRFVTIKPSHHGNCEFLKIL